MPVLLATLASTTLSVVTSLLVKLLSRDMIQSAIMLLAEKGVKATKTQEDDILFAKFKEAVEKE